MFLYIDSLFGEGRERVARPLETIPDTLSGLYLQAMREHDREAAMLRSRDVTKTPLERLQLASGPLDDVEHRIVFEGPEPEGATDLGTALDLGGTLDTPEMAQSFRQGARALAAEEPAIRHYRASTNGTAVYDELSQGQVMDRVKGVLLAEPARKGDVVFVAASEVTLDLRLALYAFLGDGLSAIVFGDPGEAGDRVAITHILSSGTNPTKRRIRE